MDTQQNIRYSTYNTLITIYGDKVKNKIDDINEQRWEAEQTKQGNIALKKDIERIKDVSPQKVLNSLLVFQNTLSQLEDTMEPETYDILSNLIANPDDDDNIFSTVTEMIAVCDYTDESLKPERKYSFHHPVDSLTEAQKLIRANDPNDLTYTMCGHCKRCMTTSHYNKDHKRRHVCKRSAQNAVVSLKNQTVNGPDTASDLIRLQLDNVDEINASFVGVNTGGGQGVGAFLNYC